jgi:geranylgeranyl transferase type-2 subunit beta
MHEHTLFDRMEDCARHGAGRLRAPQAVRAFVEGRFAAEGGCRGRGSEPDLYYTAYGLLALCALGPLSAPPGTTAFVHRAIGRPDRLDLIHLAAAVQCLRLLGAADALGTDEARRLLRAFSAPGGGWNTTASPPHPSPYGCFLAMAIGQDCNALDIEELDAALDALGACRTPDGGYANSPGATDGLTPATAAAVAALAHAGRPVPPEAADWLAERQGPEGGFTASPLLPWADLLSTGTAVFALNLLPNAPRYDRAAAARYVAGMANPDGGFHASEFDPEPDVEYIFHALLALS